METFAAIKAKLLSVLARLLLLRRRRLLDRRRDDGDLSRRPSSCPGHHHHRRRRRGEQSQHFSRLTVTTARIDNRSTRILLLGKVKAKYRVNHQLSALGFVYLLLRYCSVRTILGQDGHTGWAAMAKTSNLNQQDSLGANDQPW